MLRQQRWNPAPYTGARWRTGRRTRSEFPRQMGWDRPIGRAVGMYNCSTVVMYLLPGEQRRI